MTTAVAATNNEKTMTYAKNYGILKDISDKMRTGREDIDQLIPMVQDATAAYKACKERLEAVSRALGEAFPEDLKKV